MVIMRQHINLNDDWMYSNSFHKDMTQLLYPEDDLEKVRLPHTNTLLPYNYLDEKAYQFVSCYRKHINADSKWKGKQVLLTFEGVAHIAKVYLNGEMIMTHLGGYTAFKVDISSYLRYGEDNLLAVEVDSRETSNIPPFGYVIDYLTYGGIYREVYLDIKNQVSIEDIFITTKDIVKDESKIGSKEIEIQATLCGDIASPNLFFKYEITHRNNQRILEGEEKVTGRTTHFKAIVDKVKEWDIEEPNLYYVKMELREINQEEQRALDEDVVHFGFRTCEFKKNGFYLNGKKIKLRGLNRHQSYPYVGYAMPKRMQHKDADILKYELGVNAVRTSHYPQSKHFINRCDELGLLVFTEIPGWQHIGDEEWKETSYQGVKEMVLQYRNHPSIILWGVRINESPDDDEFYKKTNQIAHDLDSSRQTSGVRFIKKSNLIEDVYAYNDFLHNGETKGIDKKADVTSNRQAPYLVSEFNGHMFPTKSFDNEEYRLEHALRHSRVLDAIYEQEEVAGGFGWCMFDYNTHKDFGSGDRICYHGVCDMFRIPKLAAAVYASQSDKLNIFEISSSLDIGEHPAGNTGEIYAFTNGDSVRLYKDDMFIKEFYPKKDRFSNLPHPPILIDDFVGDLLKDQEGYSQKTADLIKEVLLAVKKYGQYKLPLQYKIKMAYLMLKEHISLKEGIILYYKYIGSWGGQATTFRFEAIKDNKVIKVINRKPALNPRLSILAEDRELIEEETYDVAEVRIIAVDEDGNHLPYYQEPIILKTWGAIELIGPEIVSLKGGAIGVYVKTKGIQGDGGLIIEQYNLGSQEIMFRVKL